MKTVAFCTLGCKVNQYETQAMTERMEQAGYIVVDFSCRADVYIVNSCTVTGTGDKKTRQMVRKANRLNPDAVIAVAGCYAQRAADELLRLPGVGVALGTRHKDRIAELVERAMATGLPVNAVESFSDGTGYEGLRITKKPAHTHAYIKIQDGCNRYCSYCIIPFARGPVCSRPVSDVVQEVEGLAKGGCVEAVLTGIHVASYGLDLEEGTRLPDVVEAVHAVEGIKRIRLSSLEPLALSDEWIDRLRILPKLCPHFHLSLQSGSDAVLKRMRRRYTTHEYADRVRALREAFPGCAVTTDIMVGFPGETREEFEETLDFVKSIGFARCHVFPYSKRPGTDAASMPGQVPSAVKDERVFTLIAQGKTLERDFINRQVGQVQDVLWETCEDEIIEGYTSRYVRVRAPGAPEYVGKLSPALLNSVGDDVVFALLADKDTANLPNTKGAKPLKDCLFCKIVNKEIPSDAVYEDDEVLAFKDINPQAPVHVLVIPKAHYENLAEAVRADAGLVARTLAALAEIAKDLGMEETGHRVVVNTGQDGYQTVNHLHFHLLGQRKMGWPPG